MISHLRTIFIKVRFRNFFGRITLLNSIQIAFIGISLCLILGIGPAAQFYFASLANSSTVDIYESAYRDNIAILPKFEDVFVHAFWGTMPAVALCIAIITVRNFQSKVIFFYTALSTFILITIVDVATLLYSGFRIEALTENIVANFLGGFIAAAILVLVLIFSDNVVSNLQANRYVITAAAGLISVLTSLLVLLIGFYISNFFFRPLPVFLEVIVDYPTNGFIAPPKNKDAQSDDNKGDDSKELFSFNPDTSSNEIRTRFEHPGRKLSASWSSNNPYVLYDAYVSFYTGCLSLDKKSLPVAGKSLRFDSVNSFKFFFDDGGFNTSVEKSQDFGIVTRYTPGRFSLFSLKKEDDLFSFTQFSDQHTLLYEANTEISVKMSAITYDETENIQKSRVFTIESNGQRFSFAFGGPPRDKAPLKKSDQKMTCKSLAASKPKGHADIILPKDGDLSITAVVNISRRNADSNLAGNKSILTINSEGGWMTADRIKLLDISGSRKKSLEAIFVTNLQYAVINKTKIDVNRNDNYMMVGDLKADFTADGLLRITDNANVLWKNSKRASPTKWESLDWTARTPLIAAISTVFIFLLKYVYEAASKDREIKWLR